MRSESCDQNCCTSVTYISFSVPRSLASHRVTAHDMIFAPLLLPDMIMSALGEEQQQSKVLRRQGETHRRAADERHVKL